MKALEIVSQVCCLLLNVTNVSGLFNAGFLIIFFPRYAVLFKLSGHIICIALQLPKIIIWRARYQTI